MSYVKGPIAAKELGVCMQTLRKWDKEGKIKTFRTCERGARRYDIEDFKKRYGNSVTYKKKKRKNALKKYLYCRVSSSKQKADLERQICYLKERYPTHQVIKEIASGINFKRKGLQRLLDECMQGLVEEVVVANRDRLCRFAWDHFRWLFERCKVRLVVEDNEDFDPKRELADDLMAIVHVFSCRHYGCRRGRARRRFEELATRDITEQGKDEDGAVKETGKESDSEGD